MTSNSHTSDCITEREAAQILGYTGATWDNMSGEEPQPASSDKFWAELTDEEKEAAGVLGYTRLIWDTQPPPAGSKYWADLTDDEKSAAEDLGKRVRS